MTTSQDRLPRLLALLPWLRANPGVSFATAAGEFGVPEKQLRSDLELLYMCGILARCHYETNYSAVKALHALEATAKAAINFQAQFPQLSKANAAAAGRDFIAVQEYLTCQRALPHPSTSFCR